jgi:hypothetical protein
MWSVRATTLDGLHRPVPHLEADEPFSMRTAWELAMQISRRLQTLRWPSHLMERDLGASFRREGIAPGTSSIALWNHLVGDVQFRYVDSRRSALAQFQPLEDAIALRHVDESRTKPPRFVARHDRTTLVFAIEEDVESITLEYQPTSVDRMQWRGVARSVEGIEQSWVESRFYVGARSATLLGLHPLRTYTPIPTGWERAKVQAGRRSGMCAATVLRTLGKWAKELNTDPMFDTRLQYAEHLHGQRGWPLLTRAQLPASGRIWVLVHGTLSSCYQAFEGLPASIFGTDPVFRFEHDTCAELSVNEDALCDCLVHASAGVEIVLLAHSRGGLIARGAGKRLTHAGELRDKRLTAPLNVRVLTFGTPHRGTPLVDQASGILDLGVLDGVFGLITSLLPGVVLPKVFGWFAPGAGQQLLSLLARMGMGNHVGDARYDATLVATTYSLLRAGRLPKGIDDMRDSSSYLKLLERAMSPWPGCHAWAGAFDIDSDADGFGMAFEQELSNGIFNGSANDLVIPTESARAFGDATTLEGCSHSGYFSRRDVQDALTKLQPLTR